MRLAGYNEKLIDKKWFYKVDGSHDDRLYELYEYSYAGGGKWYRYEYFVPATGYHSFKCYRNKEQALEKYKHEIELEEWRQNLHNKK